MPSVLLSVEQTEPIAPARREELYRNAAANVRPLNNAFRRGT
jgi:hypothetical protein